MYKFYSFTLYLSILMFIMLLSFILALDHFINANSLILNILVGVIVLVVIGVTFAICLERNYPTCLVSRNNQFTIKEGEEFVCFMPFSQEELDKMNVSRNVIRLVRFSLDKGISNCDIVQNKGLLTDRKLKLYSTFEYDMLFDNDSLAKVGTSGLCIFAKVGTSVSQVRRDIAEVEEKIGKCMNFFKLLEISDGTLLLRYGYAECVKNEETANIYLRTPVDNGITFYDLLLQKVFKSCPDNKEYVCSVVKRGSEFIKKNQVDDLWVNKPDGQMALFILSNFPPDQVVCRKKVYGYGISNLNKKISWIRDYINLNGKVIDGSYLSKMIDKLRDIHCQQYELNLYNNFMDYYIDDEGNTVSSLISEDCRSSSIHPYILAIASYDSDYYFDKANEFIKKILYSEGYSHLINQVKSMLMGYLDINIIDSPYSKNMHVASVLTVLSIGDKNCTGEELIKYAREYVVKKVSIACSSIM
ncbi:MAG: hypothetical protein ACTJLM_04995 [Ehrlichia sp.]